jgi:predicted membrane protein
MNLVHLEGIRDRRSLAHRRSERGEGKLKAVIYLAILLLIIYSAVKIIPIYVSNYQLTDKMQEQARFAVVNRYTEEQIRDNIFKAAQELEIPAKRDAIKVFTTNAVVKISLEYTVPVDLLFYHMDLHFAPSSENKALF